MKIYKIYKILRSFYRKEEVKQALIDYRLWLLFFRDPKMMGWNEKRAPELFGLRNADLNWSNSPTII